ncbi:MAG: glycosyltransferase [Actinomycetota bacterium]
MRRQRGARPALNSAGVPRATTQGRWITVGGRKLYVRGVTYGTFRPRDGSSFPSPETVKRDFAAMAERGLNAVRTYTVPPCWLLDLAAEHGLYVMVGVPWEQHVTFLDDSRRAASIVERVRAGVRACAGHPAILCYALGNEIPASIVRWHGRHRVERFLARLYAAAKSEDPEALITYVNYPSTEYVELPFIDLVCFNVFLESEPAFESYLARLQNIAGDRPLLVTEAGLDSGRNGERVQAEALRWQVHRSFATGAAGIFLFSWTDEWHRGGREVFDWSFGLVDRKRRPKPSLAAIEHALAETPFPPDRRWPRVSAIVCTHDGANTLPACLDALARLDYPDYEVLVVDDGSTDETAAIAERYDVRLIGIPHQGLASARNAGLAAATGSIVAYVDDDAYPDCDWLRYLAEAFIESDHAGIGGPNIPPGDEGLVAACVASAPGGPVHVLLTDRVAEHIPGCNMAFRKDRLEAVGGFDPQFRTAGDDVDICWQLQDAGHTVGFSAGAVVYHRRRDSVLGYLRQQYGYGKAEASLERKWPSRHDHGGYPSWSGRVYGRGLRAGLRRRRRVDYGRWGTGLFQAIYQPSPGLIGFLPLLPEAYLALSVLAVLGALGALWSPLLLALPLLGIVASALVASALMGGGAAHAAAAGRSRLGRARRRALTSALFLVQPLARLAGRLRNRRASWRQRASTLGGIPRVRHFAIWSERWSAPEARLHQLEQGLIREGGVVRRGSSFDRWDLEVGVGMLAAARLRTAVEEHGSGRQMARIRAWPKLWLPGFAAVALLAVLAASAWMNGAPAVALILALGVIGLAALATLDSSAAMGVLSAAVQNAAQQADVAEARAERPEPADGPLERVAARVAGAVSGTGAPAKPKVNEGNGVSHQQRAGGSQLHPEAEKARR